MKIDEKTYKAMPTALQALFHKCPNPGSDEVLACFPETAPSKPDYRKDQPYDNNVYSKGWKRQPSILNDSGSAARFFYCAKASKQDRDEGCEGLDVKCAGAYGEFAGDGRGRQTEHQPAHNFHPTVKPTTLMRYLCRLVTPPNGLVLDPFMGSGSTGKAAILEGFNFEGIDLDEEYLKIAEARIKWAEDQQPLLKDI